MARIKLVFRGDPVAQGRPRFTRTGHAYDPPKSRKFKEAIHWEAESNLLKRKSSVPAFGNGEALGIAIWVYIEPPKSWPVKKKQAAIEGKILPTARPDLGNYEKGIEDALNGICYTDDSQIVSRGNGGKRYGIPARVEVELWEVNA